MDHQFERETPPLRPEVARAIRETTNGKSTGSDDFPFKLSKTGGDMTLDRMHKIYVAVWRTGVWSNDWADSIFITLPKKGDLTQCNYRTNALVSHASKLQLRIILERIWAKTEAEIADERILLTSVKAAKMTYFIHILRKRKLPGKGDYPGCNIGLQS